MKRIVPKLLLLCLGIGIILSLRAGKIPAQPEPEQGQIAAITSSVSPSPSPYVVPAKPERIQIPKIGVDTTVEEVGLEADGRMGVPESAYTVGWWNRGVRPGETGSAVLAGHLDTPQGTEGVFYSLDDIAAGDEIISYAGGKKYVFTVTSQQTYPDATFPIDKVFSDVTGSYLNLITCWGTFDKHARNYDERLVVYSKLKSIE